MNNQVGISTTTEATRRQHCRLRWSAPLFGAALLAVTGLQLPDQTLLWRELQNTGHILVFGALALLTLCSLRSTASAGRQHPLRIYLVAGSITLLSGIAVEAVQAVTGGDADVYDIVRDAIGILIVLLASAGFDAAIVRPPRFVLLGIATALAIAGSWPITSLAMAYYQRAQAFPVIFAPAADWQSHFIHLKQARLDRTHDASTCAAASMTTAQATLRLEPVRYAGISIIEPEPDWHDRDFLLLDVYSTKPAPVELTLRIHDARHNQDYSDRYNRVLKLAPGANRFRIPLADVRNAPAGRRMDMTRIAGVMLFIFDATAPVTLCAGPLWLE